MRALVHILAGMALFGSGSLLWIFVKMRSRGRRLMAEHGVHEPIPLPPAAWLIVVAWLLVFCGALAVLIFAP